MCPFGILYWGAAPAGLQTDTVEPHNVAAPAGFLCAIVRFSSGSTCACARVRGCAWMCVDCISRGTPMLLDPGAPGSPPKYRASHRSAAAGLPWGSARESPPLESSHRMQCLCVRLCVVCLCVQCLCVCMNHCLFQSPIVQWAWHRDNIRDRQTDAPTYQDFPNGWIA